MNVKKHIVGLAFLFVGSVVLWSCGGDAGTAPEGGQGEDQYPELNKACQVWRMGGGSVATGSNGSSTIYYVTSLEDKDAYKPVDGTLRYAINNSGARLIVFDVAGTIHLCAPLEVTHGDLTILGQSAPGQGICIADYPLILKKVDNVIIRFVRFRLGKKSLEKDQETDYDAISVNDCKKIMIDHCSASWSVDECVSCYGNEDFTLQYSFITESLRNAGHVKGPHGYGGIWGGKNVTFHHNLLAHHDSRNPRFDHDYVNIKYAGPIDFVNNVIYNWGDNSSYGGEGSTEGAGGRHINMVKNYYKPGNSTKSSVKTRIVDPWVACDNCTKSTDGEVAPGGTICPPVIYLTGNVMYNSDLVTQDNWKGANHSDHAEIKADNRWTAGLTPLPMEETADDAYATVLAKAGCSPSRDAVDERIVANVQNGTGTIIDDPEQVGGFPVLSGDDVIEDADGDRIPDAWETQYGLDPNNRRDAMQKTLVSGYTNYEVYLNDKVKNLY